MQIKITISVLTSQVSVAIDEEGRRVETLLLPLPDDHDLYEDIEDSFDLDIEPETYGAVPGLVLPSGYYAIGVFVGKALKRILLTGHELSFTARSLKEVYDEVAANEAKLGRSPSRIPGLK